MTNPFLAESRRAIPRLLASLNRNEFAPRKGSFDRAYWHYRAVTGFESATFCQGVLPLALLHDSMLFGEAYQGHPEILRLIEAGLEHWASLQHADGSFDEWYPNERSHVATAFTSYAISEAMLLVKDAVNGATRARVMTALGQAGRWLATHLDDKVLNHTAGAIPALHNIILLTGEDSLREGLDRNIALMKSLQSPEGWFPENGGFDAGYLSLSLDYLWTYHEKSGDREALEMARRGFSFLKHLVHPDGTSGGEYTARNTQYLMPRGLIAAARVLPDAAFVARHHLAALEAGRALTPSDVDDRYMIFFLLPNFMQAALRFAASGAPVRPSAAPPSVHFPDAGLLVRRGESFHFALNYRKAGAFKFFAARQDDWSLAGADHGWFARLADGRVVSTQYLAGPDDSLTVDLPAAGGDGRIVLRRRFRKVNHSLPLDKFQLPFLLYAVTLGRFPAINALLEKTVKNLFIRKPGRSHLILDRVIELTGARIVIRDRITGADGESVELCCGGPSTAPHVPSSRFFVAAERWMSPFRDLVTLPIEIETTVDLDRRTILRRIL